MHIKLANNMRQPLASGKAAATGYVTIATPTGSGTPFYDAFNSYMAEGEALVPITVCMVSDDSVVANGYATHWNFSSEDGRIYVDANLAAETIPADCYIACRMRAELMQAGRSALRSYAYWDNSVSFVSLPAAADHHFVEMNYGSAASCTIVLNGFSAVANDYELPDGNIARHHTIVVSNIGTAPTLYFDTGATDSIHWRDGSAPAFSIGYNRLRITLTLAETGNWPGTAHWLGSWEKFAD